MSAPERPGATTPAVEHAERLREAVRVLRSEVTILRQATKVAEDNERAALRLAKKETDTVATLRAERDRLRAALESLVALYGPETDYHHVIEPYAWAEIIALISEETTNG